MKETKTEYIIMIIAITHEDRCPALLPNKMLDCRCDRKFETILYEGPPEHQEEFISKWLKS